MKRLRSVGRWSAFSVLAIGIFEACTSSNDATAVGAPVVPTVALEMPFSSVGCDDTLVVHVTTSWHLNPPFYCALPPNCGSIQVTLLEKEDDTVPLLTQRAATMDVQLDLSPLISPPTADAPTLSQVHFIKAQLFTDTLEPVVANPPGNGSQTEPISLQLPIDCSGEGGASAGGAPAEGGAAPGSSAGAAGQAGQGGAPSGGGTGGTGGTSESGAGGEVTASGGAPI